MATGIDFRALSRAKMSAAKLLLRKGDFNGVIDNVGFSLELALKAVICKKLRLQNYPDSLSIALTKTEKEIINFFKTHDFVTLLLLSGYSVDFSISPSTQRQLAQNWGVLAAWSPDVRYEPVGTYSQTDAQNMLNAANDRRYGVMSYLKKRW